MKDRTNDATLSSLMIDAITYVRKAAHQGSRKPGLNTIRFVRDRFGWTLTAAKSDRIHRAEVLMGGGEYAEFGVYQQHAPALINDLSRNPASVETTIMLQSDLWLMVTPDTMPDVSSYLRPPTADARCRVLDTPADVARFRPSRNEAGWAEVSGDPEQSQWVRVWTPSLYQAIPAKAESLRIGLGSKPEDLVMLQSSLRDGFIRLTAALPPIVVQPRETSGMAQREMI